MDGVGDTVKVDKSTVLVREDPSRLDRPTITENGIERTVRGGVGNAANPKGSRCHCTILVDLAVEGLAHERSVHLHQPDRLGQFLVVVLIIK